MAEGISPNPLNKISQVYLDRIAKINSDPEIAQKEREKWQTEAKVDTGSAEEKATTRNKRNTPPGKDSKFDTSVFITRKPGESLDSARTRKRRDAHAAKRGVKEDYKKLPVAKMAKKISDKSFKSGQSGVSTKSAEQTGKMIGVLDTHDPQRSKAKSKIKEDKKPGLWANIHARRKAGKPKRKPGDKNYPKTLDIEEDKAFHTVLGNLRKKYEGGVLSTKQDFDNLKKQNASKSLDAKQIQQKDNRSAAQREVDAQYGRTAINKQGSLGT